MRYIIRSIKYFICCVIVLALALAAVVLFGAADWDIGTLFRNGYDALWQIAIVFAGVAAGYPKIGYLSRTLSAECRPETVTECMTALGYIPEKTEPGLMTFRHGSTMSRLSRMFEDRITFSETPEGHIQVEGLRKDVVRISGYVDRRAGEDAGGQG